MQSVTPATMSATPIRVSRGRIFSPSAAPATAVTANVVAFVTGTASVIGLSPSLMTNRTDMERLSRNGSEYCQTHSKRIQSPRKLATMLLLLPLCFCASAAARLASSAMSAPRLRSALVIPHTVPMASSHPTTAIAAAAPAQRHSKWPQRDAFSKPSPCSKLTYPPVE
jgi:hypothetical protein